MRHEVRVPPTADGALEVTIVCWLKAVGDVVIQGEDLVEAKTEKIALYITAPVTGKLVEIVLPAGSKARVGDIVGYIEGV